MMVVWVTRQSARGGSRRRPSVGTCQFLGCSYRQVATAGLEANVEV